MDLEYLDLISFEPIALPNIGKIRSPKLKEIAALSYSTYQLYLSVLAAPSFKNEDKATKEAVPLRKPFDKILMEPLFRTIVLGALNFFMEDQVIYQENLQLFFTYDGTKDSSGSLIPTGKISHSNYDVVCDVILTRNYIQNGTSTKGRPGNKKAADIIEKLEKGRSRKKKNTNDGMDLGNIISSVASIHPSLNLISIWDLTVYQLWDCFQRLSINQLYQIQSMSVAAWGDKEKQFDLSMWYHYPEHIKG